MSTRTSEQDSGERITLADGEGGRLTRRLIQDRIVPAVGGRVLAGLGDAAEVPGGEGALAITTDSYVVTPLFFPGGDIGSLAVNGTVNDLAVCGAAPLYLTLSLILEEGLPLSVLDRVLRSVAKAAREAGVEVVAGDTKVVPRGAADGMFINTAGVGRVESALAGPAALRESDELLVSGPLGRHGIAILCAREELALTPAPSSDSAPLIEPARALRSELGPRLKAMRDATRGGVAAVLHEWAAACGLTLSIDAGAAPVSKDVRGACELLGLDPLHVANEGVMVVAVEAGSGAKALETLHSAGSCEPARIGQVTVRQPAPVTIKPLLGPDQALDDPPGAPLPRIC